MTDHTDWCREFFNNRLKDGALWHVPRSGLVFRRCGDRLRLVASVPAEEKRFDTPFERERDYQQHKLEFGKAGVSVEFNGDVPAFENFDEVEKFYIVEEVVAGVRVNPIHRRRCVACHLVKPESEYPSRGALACNFCTPVSDNLTNRILGDASVPGFTMPSAMTPPKPHRFGPGYDDIRTQRATKSDDSVFDLLMQAGKKKPAKAPDTRPLLDRLHEATFTDAIGLDFIQDRYALRGIIRKAHCFTLDADTSALVAEFSIAIANDLEGARRMAIPPFPVTWVDIDNVARLNRIQSMGYPLTPQAKGETEVGAPVERVGWLIQPSREIEGSYYASYVADVEQGALMAPLSFWWSTNAANTEQVKASGYVHQLCLGMEQTNVNPADAYIAPNPQQDFEVMQKKFGRIEVGKLMAELAGELRHIWGFLIALGAGQLGIEVKMKPQPLHTDIRKMPNGKPLLPLEHKLLHLHLNKRHTPEKVVTRMTTHHKHRWHEVRAHFRTLRNADGSVKKRVPVKPHERGDERLGRITKTYRVER